jgi:hypothetical protein
MAIATQQIHSGILAEARYSGRKLSIIAETSEWFESQTGTGPDYANNLSVTLQIEAVVRSSEAEVLKADLYQSKDLHTWSLKNSFTFAIGAVGNFEDNYLYLGTIEKYFKVQFSIDDPDHGDIVGLPYPNFQLEFQGTCWVTVANIDT